MRKMFISNVGAEHEEPLTMPVMNFGKEAQQRGTDDAGDADGLAVNSSAEAPLVAPNWEG